MDAVISFGKGGPVFHINRVAFSIGNIEVYWYGLIIGLAILVGVCLALVEIKKTDLTLDDFLNMFLIGVPVAIVCARLYYVIFSWDMYKDNPLEIFNLRGGGIAIYGALIGIFLMIIIYSRIKKIRLGVPFDILGGIVPFCQAIGRWGNFVNGEAFGRQTNLPWAMTIEREIYPLAEVAFVVAENVHPTFLYESLWNLLTGIFLWIYKKHKKFEGEVFCLYLISYGIGRFLIEGLRTDSLYLGPFRVSQLVALATALVGIIIIYKNRKKI